MMSFNFFMQLFVRNVILFKHESLHAHENFNNQRFYHSELAAILCEKMNKKSEAKEYATKALEYSKITTPDFARHKTLGLVKATDEQIKRLKKIAGR